MKKSYILFSISLLLMGFGLLMAPNMAHAWSSYDSSYGYGMTSPCGYTCKPYAFSGAGAFFGYDSSSNIRPANLYYGHMNEAFGYRPTYQAYPTYNGHMNEAFGYRSTYQAYPAYNSYSSSMMASSYNSYNYNSYANNYVPATNYSNYGYNNSAFGSGYNNYNNYGYGNGESCYGYGC